MCDLARILMAIDNLENRCLNRKNLTQKKGKDDPKNFNLFKERAVYAKQQLHLIAKNLKDLRTIVETIHENKDKEGIRMKIKDKKDNNEII